MKRFSVAVQTQTGHFSCFFHHIAMVGGRVTAEREPTAASGYGIANRVAETCLLTKSTSYTRVNSVF